MESLNSFVYSLHLIYISYQRYMCISPGLACISLVHVYHWYMYIIGASVSVPQTSMNIDCSQHYICYVTT
jgi:hypothetical protein